MLDIIADVFDFVRVHFQIIFATMCGLTAAAWINVR